MTIGGDDLQARAGAGGAPRILFAVTADVSLRLLRGYPAHLAANGWDVHVVCSPGAMLSAAVDADDGVVYHSLAMRREPSPLADLRALRSFVRLVRSLRPDVVSAGTPKAGLLGMVAARLSRVPARIYHQRGLRLESERGAKRLVLWMIERITTASATITLAVSHSLRQRLVHERLARPGDIVVLGAGSSNGVDVEEFADVEPAAVPGIDRQRRPVIGFVGRVTADKGFESLSDALKMLANGGTAPSLMVIGRVEDPSASAFLDGLRAAGVPVVTTGHVKNPAPYYPLMTALCLPTRREGFPNVVLEAAASGIPTVTTTATGAVDSVVDEVTGLLVPVDDPAALAEALSTITRDGRAASMGEAARAHVAAHYDRADVWRLLDAFYAEQLRRDRVLAR